MNHLVLNFSFKFTVIFNFFSLIIGLPKGVLACMLLGFLDI